MNENILTESEIKQVLEQVKTAFPFFTAWEYNNEKNEEYFGFSVWGELVINPEELMPRRLFITLDKTHENKWQGSLTIGQHSYLWSSADVGDAHLLDTEPCETLEEAIVALKAKMLELWRAFSAL
ncbi:hypothetical protein [Iningainema tapete]|uniref:Uncharacterized protein n=1 Tax=Iningainema tapete BLCC-T55 TaxID=2748662 RepID=A0A8J7C5M9_9CYAN|nr:hypothetical protein [Iningainema tapete]MBD2771016.1 hypothetical protein [Iningainema tapete BLCC-T55]